MQFSASLIFLASTLLALTSAAPLEALEERQNTCPTCQSGEVLLCCTGTISVGSSVVTGCGRMQPGMTCSSNPYCCANQEMGVGLICGAYSTGPC